LQLHIFRTLGFDMLAALAKRNALTRVVTHAITARRQEILRGVVAS